MITPRRAGTIETDLGALFELLDLASAASLAGIALFGSTGEFVHYTLEERARVANLCVKRSRAPVLVNVSHSTFEGTLYLAEAAAGSGAAGALVMPPYYFEYSQEDVEAFFIAIGGAASNWMPVYLYNIPFFTTAMAVATAVRLLRTGLFAGIKESSGDWEMFEALSTLRLERPFDLYAGNDRIFSRARLAGAAGIISGIACAVPELLVALDGALLAGQTGVASRLEARLYDFILRSDELPAPIAIREAVGMRGIKPGPHAAPLGETGLRKLYEFREWFPGWLSAVLRECKNA